MVFALSPVALVLFAGISVSDAQTTGVGKSGCTSGASVCEACPAGQRYDPESNSCLLCSPGYFSPEGSSACFACAAGKIASSEGSVECVRCQPGQEASSDGTFCSQCTPGWFSPAEGSSCSPCPRGQYESRYWQPPQDNGEDYYAGGTGSGSGSGSGRRLGRSLGPYGGDYGPEYVQDRCTECPPGFVSENLGGTYCSQCSSGMYEIGRTKCEECPSAHYCAAGDCSYGCPMCPAGKVPSEERSHCEDCPPGYFAPMGATECKPCPPNRYTAMGPDSPYDAAAGGASECLKCPAGSEAKDGLRCEICPDGYASEEDGATCRACPKGTVPDKAKTSCQQCPGGKVAPTNGLSDCVDCPGGTYSPSSDSKEGVDGIHHDCLPCPPGTISNESSTECSQCSDTNMRPNADSTACLYCVLGSVSRKGDVGCTICPSGRFRYGTLPFMPTSFPSIASHSEYIAMIREQSLNGTGSSDDSTDSYATEPESPYGCKVAETPTTETPTMETPTTETPTTETLNIAVKVTTPKMKTMTGCASNNVQCFAAFSADFFGLLGKANNKDYAPEVVALSDCVLRMSGSERGQEPECSTCPAGYQVAKVDQLGLTCEPCEYGYYSPHEGATCRPCGYGMSTGQEMGATECYPCNDGEVAPRNRMAYCEQCGQGTVSNERKTKCVPCGEGSAAMCANTDSSPESGFGSGSGLGSGWESGSGSGSGSGRRVLADV